MLKISLRIIVFILVVFFTCEAFSYSREDFIVKLENGEVCGHHIVEYLRSNRIHVHYQCIENGRGENLFEQIKLSPSGHLLQYQVTGESEMGGAIHEDFELRNGVARWNSTSESGHQKVDGHPFYLPIDATLAVNSLMISELNRSPNKKIKLIPSGELSQDVLVNKTITNSTNSIKVQLLMLTGIGLKPNFIWATTGKTPKFFAFISPGYSIYLKEWESSIHSLQAEQNSMIALILEKRAQKIQHPIEGLLMIKNIAIFESKNATVSSPKNVYVLNGRIHKITPASESFLTPSQVIDGSDQLLMPGLFDMHAHVNDWSGAYNLANGVTTVRDMGNQNTLLQQMLVQIKEGKLLSPNIIPAGLIEGKSEYSNSDGLLITTIEEAKSAVDYYFDSGYKHIKLYSSFPKEFVNPTAAYAHSKGMTVGGHVPAFMSSKEAIENGYDEINHMNQLLLYLVSTPETDTRTIERFYLPAEKFQDLDFESKEIKNLISLLKKRNITIDPTLAGFDFLKQRDGEVAEPFKSIDSNMPIDIQRSFRVGAMKIPDVETSDRYKKSYQKMVEFTGRLYQEGVSIVAGTDTFAGFGLHSELSLYVKAGLSPAQAIQLATYQAAKISGTFNDRGSIEEGKLADLIMVQGQPTQTIEDLRKITLVLTRGYAIIPNEIYSLIHVKPFLTSMPLSFQ